MRSRSCKLERFVAFMLAVSVSVCCCQAQFLLHGFDRTDAGHPRGVAADDGACCSNCAEDVQVDSDQGERPAAPPTSCKSCCVKGSGLKDGITIPPPTLADVLPFDAETTAIVSTSPVIHTSPAVTLPPFVAPRTLLRLRCALIV